MTPTKGELPRREEVPAELKWRLEDIYATEEEWEQGFAELRRLLPELRSYQGRLMESPRTLLAALRLADRVGELLLDLYAYARMRRDEDNTVTRYQGMTDRAAALRSDCGAALAFMVPEILAADPAKVETWLGSDEDLALYRHRLHDILRRRPHTLSAELEELLAQTEVMAEGPQTIFTMLARADLKFPTVKDEEGQEVPLSEGRYHTFMLCGDRRVRRDAFTALYETYGRYENTWAAIYSASVRKDVFYSRARRFASSLEAALHEDNIPPAVYRNLVQAVRRHLPALHRYMSVRRRRLGVDTLHMYDLYVPIVAQADREVPYEEATRTVLAALRPLGEEYLAALRNGLAGGWVDVLENKGKTTGAYSWGTYGSHPFVLLNYQGTLHDVFTLAHEMGHAMHSYFTWASQPFVYADYSSFVAEVASTLNENLLLHHLLEHTEDEAERLYLLNQHLEDFRTTVFRQTMFAEFELLTHERVESGEALTPEFLKGVYRDLNAAYYGPEVHIDEEIALEWARVPHFYRPFYVYKYATGYSAATALAEQVLREGDPAAGRYLEFLKAGGSDYPIEVLKRAGVDMTTPEPVERALEVFERLVGEMERATGEAYRV
ncbi:MAG: oligoendopeptidase F [Firmicutes bacterium]|nr:oligoendopeptidase F [Bacillota bacterium]